MLSLNPSSDDVDYSLFGGRPAEGPDAVSQTEQTEEQPVQQKDEVDYAQFGGKPAKPPKEKVGKFQSLLYGLAEGPLALEALRKEGVNRATKFITKNILKSEKSDEEIDEQLKNPALETLSEFPESKDEASRRIRLAGQVGPISAIGGPLAALYGLIGSQAGQTYREAYGKEGKFEEFGKDEAIALGIDFATSLGAGALKSVVQAGVKGTANKIPAIFGQTETGLQKQVIKNAVQGEKAALENVIDGFSKSQVNGFQEAAESISPNKYTQLAQTDHAGLTSEAQTMWRGANLRIISPIEATPVEAGTAMQQVANETFRTEVLAAERQAYTAAEQEARGTAGTAPRTLAEARALRDELTAAAPTPEQQPVIAFLNKLIGDLETTTAETVTPASRILDARGNPVTQAVRNEATTVPTTRSGNDLVTMVQNANHAVNYGAEVREQSHRLIPIVNTLRQETGTVLAQKPAAARAYQEANLLHGRNAEVWGTKNMRNVRFTENPESLIAANKKPSNMRNFKQAVQEPWAQNLLDRMVVENITETGGSDANRLALRNLGDDLSPQARGVANNLIDVKDPLTSIGNRELLSNQILQEAARAVNTGKRPEKILKLMETSKGYQLVKGSMMGTPKSRELFKSFERLYMEDIVTSISDELGAIDFSKARNIFKNPDTRKVVQQIGGDSLVNRFQQLEKFANNFAKNIDLYSKPETQTLLRSLVRGSKESLPVAVLLHALHVPWPILAGTGIALTGAKVGKLTFDALQKRLLSNPKAVHYLEALSKATTTAEIAKQFPRLLAEMQKGEK